MSIKLVLKYYWKFEAGDWLAVGEVKIGCRSMQTNADKKRCDHIGLCHFDEWSEEKSCPPDALNKISPFGRNDIIHYLMCG
jgi:hypothetical protein